MKTISFTLLAAFFGFSAMAQQDPADDQDRLQQQAPRPAQTQVERSANTNAQNQSNKDLEAERLAKEKGQTQKQTKVQPEGLPPNLTDTIQPSSKPRKPNAR